MKRFYWSAISTLSLSFVLVACGSNVKLNDVPVETRNVSGVTPAATPGDTSGANSRGVESVQINRAEASAPGPVGVAKVIYFDYDSYTIKPEFQNVIDANARYLTANTTRRLAIEGHTDERGGREYNLALGQKRAEAVRRALALLGVVDAQAEAVSFGKEKPTATGSDEDSLAKNRRAELNYR